LAGRKQIFKNKIISQSADVDQHEPAEPLEQWVREFKSKINLNKFAVIIQ
jgi:hypothetical protein